MSHTYLNKVQFIGNTGNNPELRSTRDGVEVTNLSLAVQSPSRSEPCWFKLVLWRKQAEYVVARVGKGSQLYVEGELEVRTWTDDEGHQRSETVVHVRELQVLHRRDPVAQGASGEPSRAPEVVAEAPVAAPPAQEAPKKTRASRAKKTAQAA
jgi:single-strand DNA-binding protein